MRAARFCTVFGGILAATLAWADFDLTLVHTNDMHAHAEPTVVSGKSYGGYARLGTAIMEELGLYPNAVLVDAGDVFQGTLYFNVYEGLADLAFMNYVGYQAMAAGNHEFDRGTKPFGAFVDNALFPVLAANLDVSENVDLRGKIKPSTVIEVGEEKVGFIGAITPDLDDITMLPDTVKVLPWVESVQKAADELKAQGINKIVLLSHSSFEVDSANAARLRGVDVIVCGHSHTPLGSFGDALPGTRQPEGDYPTVLKDADGNTTLLVAAWEWGKVLGRITVTFDDAGLVKTWEGRPRLIDESVVPAPVIESMIAAFRKPIEQLMTQRVGDAAEAVPQGEARNGESAMGNMIADAMLAMTEANDSVIALMNGGGVRAGYEAGEVTFGEAITVQPFGNTLGVADVTGAELKQMLEHGVRTLPEGSGALLHVSTGSRYTVDLTRPAGDRVTEVIVAGEPLDPNKTYRITLNNFTAGGGDGHLNLKGRTDAYYYDTGIVDIDATVDFINKANGVITPVMEGRIRINGA